MKAPRSWAGHNWLVTAHPACKSTIWKMLIEAGKRRPLTRLEVRMRCASRPPRPWTEQGICYSTYYRRLKRARLLAAEIRRRYRRGKAGMAALRVAELNREFTDRYGCQVLPDDDAGGADVVIMLHHLARRSGYPEQRIAAWLDRRAPWWNGDFETILLNPMRWRADTLGKLLGLTEERRKRLKIRTIGSIDGPTAAERKKFRRIEGIERKRAARRAAGILPRPKPDSRSINTLAPWNAEAISRRTWFRRRARLNGTSHAAVYAYVQLDPFHCAKRRRSIRLPRDGRFRARGSILARGGRQRYGP